MFVLCSVVFFRLGVIVVIVWVLVVVLCSSGWVSSSVRIVSSSRCISSSGYLLNWMCWCGCVLVCS